MRTYYNDIDPYCCRVLRKQIAAGNLPAGDVDDRDIRDVRATDLVGYTNWHLFAGIGGIPLGFQWAGVPDDLGIVTGGFPCQDISNAGKRAGIDGERSGLWAEYARILGELRPRYVLVENVSALLGRGIGRVLGDLAALGYDAEWHCIPAAAVGAPHIRDRIFILAYAAGKRCSWGISPGIQQRDKARYSEHSTACALVADADEPRLEERQGISGDNGAQRSTAKRNGRFVPYADRESLGRFAESWRERGLWTTESGIRRVVDGLPHRVDRLRGLGNAVVPQIAEYIGRQIVAFAANSQ